MDDNDLITQLMDLLASGAGEDSPEYEAAWQLIDTERRAYLEDRAVSRFVEFAKYHGIPDVFWRDTSLDENCTA